MKGVGTRTAVKTITQADVKAELLKDPEFRRVYEESEPADQLARLRILRGLTQQEMADRAGMTQSIVARVESGRANPSLSTLERLAEALGGHVKITI